MIVKFPKPKRVDRLAADDCLGCEGCRGACRAILELFTLPGLVVKPMGGKA